MEISNAAFFEPEAGADPMWKVRVEVQGTGFVHRAMPVVALVGDVPVEALIVGMAGDGFVGHLRAVPPVAAVLKVGYLDSELMDTDFTYQALSA